MLGHLAMSLRPHDPLMPPADPKAVPQRRVQPRIDLIYALQPIAEGLLAECKVQRVNIRVATTGDPHYPVLGEALAEGAFSLSGGMSQLGFQGEDIHRQPTVTLMRQTGQVIVQRDTSIDPPLVPHAQPFGGHVCQMLTPLHHDGTFVGFMAVHGFDKPREWSSEDIAALDRGRATAEAVLDEALWFDVPWPFEVG